MPRLVTVQSVLKSSGATHVQNTVQVFQGDYRTCVLFVTSVISLTPTCISHLVALSDFQWLSLRGCPFQGSPCISVKLVGRIYTWTERGKWWQIMCHSCKGNCNTSINNIQTKSGTQTRFMLIFIVAPCIL